MPPFTASAVPSWPLGLAHRDRWHAFTLQRQDTVVLIARILRLTGSPSSATKEHQ